MATIVRVQRWPPHSLLGKSLNPNPKLQLFRVFDQHHARECLLTEVPPHIEAALDSRGDLYRNWGYFSGAEYDYDSKEWDLSQATYLKRDRRWR